MTRLFFEKSRIFSMAHGSSICETLHSKSEQKPGIKKASLWEWATGRAVTVTIGEINVSVNKASLSKFLLRNAENPLEAPKPLNLSQHFFAPKNHVTGLPLAQLTFNLEALRSNLKFYDKLNSTPLQESYREAFCKNWDLKARKILDEMESINGLTKNSKLKKILTDSKTTLEDISKQYPKLESIQALIRRLNTTSSTTKITQI